MDSKFYNVKKNKRLIKPERKLPNIKIFKEPNMVDRSLKQETNSNSSIDNLYTIYGSRVISK